YSCQCATASNAGAPSRPAARVGPSPLAKPEIKMLNQLWRLFSWVDVFENHVGAYVMRWRGLIIVLSFLATLAVGSGIAKIEIDPSYRIFIEKDHPQLLDYDRMDAEYSDSDGLIVAVDFGEGNTAFTRENLE